jgi:hypothetical protein
MTCKLFRPAVAALGLLGGLAAAAAAQPAPPAGPAKAPAAPQRQVIRWPGGWLSLDGPEVILRDGAATGSTNVITNSGNGVGNRIVVDNGGVPGVTVLRNVRNGVGTA